MSNLNSARYLALGVAVPIMNNKYRIGTTIITVLANDGPTFPGPTWIFVVDPTTPAAINQTLISGKDKLLIGPSTHVDNPGAREIITVDSTTYPGTIHTATEPSFLYMAGDPVSGVGNLLGGNWAPSTDIAIPAGITPVGIRDEDYGEDAVSGGVYDPYRGYVKLGINAYLEQDLGNLLLPDTQYLFGCFYQAPAHDVGGPNIRVRVYDGTGLGATDLFINQTIYATTSADVTSWTLFTSATLEDLAFSKDYINGVTGSAPTACILRFPAAQGGSSGGTWIATDAPFLCHAQRTTAYRAGIFTFDCFPVLGSTRWTWINKMRQIRLANDGLREYDPTGGAGRFRKHAFQCQFENVSSDFFDNLMILQQWQEEGNDLVLLTGEQYYGATIPPVVVGKMTMKTVDKSSWALGLRSFTFSFEET